MCSQFLLLGVSRCHRGLAGSLAAEQADEELAHAPADGLLAVFVDAGLAGRIRATGHPCCRSRWSVGSGRSRRIRCCTYLRRVVVGVNTVKARPHVWPYRLQIRRRTLIRGQQHRQMPAGSYGKIGTKLGCSKVIEGLEERSRCGHRLIRQIARRI